MFERLFGEGGTAAERRAALKKRASLLDCGERRHRPSADASSAPADRASVEQYLDTIREVERRIQKAEATRRDDAAARISTGRSACPPPTPTTRS